MSATMLPVCDGLYDGGVMPLNCINSEVSDSFGVCPVVVLHELGEIKEVSGGEFFLHLIELVSAHGVDVSSLEMSLICCPIVLLALECNRTVHVVSYQPVVLFIL